MNFSLFEYLYLLFLVLFIFEILKLVHALVTRRKVTNDSASELPFISVIIPVRNEEERIGKCLSGITQQSYPEHLYEIIVVDDFSEDRTREIVDEFAMKCKNLSVFAADPIPNGWSGKSNANHLASQRARGELMIFMDADVFANPELLVRTSNHAMLHKIDVMSIVPHRQLISWAERLLLAPVFLIIAAEYQYRKVQLSGEFILFRRNVYEALGGHTVVRSTVSDDLDFAALLGKTAFKTDFVYAEDLATTRMYINFSGIYEGISKMYQRLLSENEWVAVWRSTKYFLITLFALISASLFFTGFHLHFFSAINLLILPALMLAVFIAMTFYLRINFLYGLLMPLGWLFQPVFLIRSIRGKHTHYHKWRGRKVYHQTEKVSS